ncbi:MAG: LamG domain-containing protein [Desulfobacterales bacterium]|nr:LamG domain-containing protein [Desulfobacterales bacterium]
MAIAGVDIGRELLNVNMGELLLNMASSIADAQWALDKNSMIVSEMMSGQRVLRDLDSGELITFEGEESRDLNKVPVILDSRVYFGFDVLDGKRTPAKVSMMELGFAPNFYQFVDTIIEIKMEITLNGGVEREKSSKGDIKRITTDTTETTTTSTTRHHWWWWGYNRTSTHSNVQQHVDVKATPVDATHSSKYNYSAEGSSLLRTKLTPIPPPALLEERIRFVLEQEEEWKKQQRLLEPAPEFIDDIGGLWFNGFNTAAALPKANALGLIDKSFTAEAMIRIDDFKGGDETVLGTDSRGRDRGLHLVLRNRKLYMGFYGNDLAGRTMLSAGVWYHVAYRYNKKKKEQAVFLNGVLDNRGAGHAPFKGDYNVHIGRWANGHYFNGYIDEVRIWNSVRTDAEINNNQRKRIGVSEKNLKALWRLDEQPDDKKTIANLTGQSGLNGTLLNESNAIWAQSV